MFFLVIVLWELLVNSLGYRFYVAKTSVPFIMSDTVQDTQRYLWVE